MIRSRLERDLPAMLAPAGDASAGPACRRRNYGPRSSMASSPCVPEEAGRAAAPSPPTPPGKGSKTILRRPDDFEFISGGPELIDRVGPLWERLRDHHRARAGRFAAWFARQTFAWRKDYWLRITASGALLVELVHDRAAGVDAGYCVSSLDGAGGGEIESIYVDEGYRGQGLGGRLLLNGLDWLAANGAKEPKIVVACGNEEALGFYARHGFFPRTYVLRRPPAD